MRPPISIIIPVYNEAPNINQVLDQLIVLIPDAEIIVINDGSTDDTSTTLEQRGDVRVIHHPYNIGNGAAIKSGIRAARGQVIVMMDGDGQHNPADVLRLLEATKRYDMVVGARTDKSAIAIHRALANNLYNVIASYLVGRRVPDLTSGFRAIRAYIAKRFIYLLPNGFSYPTTLTIAVFRSGHTVAYEPIVGQPRGGDTKSKIRLLRDGPGFLLVLMRIGVLFAPLKIFLPLALLLFLLGTGYGAWLLIFQGRFTNMPPLLILSGILLFMLGLISEQIALVRFIGAGDAHYSEEPEE